MLMDIELMLMDLQLMLMDIPQDYAVGYQCQDDGSRTDFVCGATVCAVCFDGV